MVPETRKSLSERIASMLLSVADTIETDPCSVKEWNTILIRLSRDILSDVLEWDEETDMTSATAAKTSRDALVVELNDAMDGGKADNDDTPQRGGLFHYLVEAGKVHQAQKFLAARASVDAASHPLPTSSQDSVPLNNPSNSVGSPATSLSVPCVGHSPSDPPPIENPHLRQKFIDTASSVLSSSPGSEWILSVVAEVVAQKCGKPFYDNVKKEYGSLLNAISDIPGVVIRKELTQVYCSLPDAGTTNSHLQPVACNALRLLAVEGVDTFLLNPYKETLSPFVRDGLSLEDVCLVCAERSPGPDYPTVGYVICAMILSAKQDRVERSSYVESLQITSAFSAMESAWVFGVTAIRDSLWAACVYSLAIRNRQMAFCISSPIAPPMMGATMAMIEKLAWKMNLVDRRQHLIFASENFQFLVNICPFDGILCYLDVVMEENNDNETFRPSFSKIVNKAWYNLVCDHFGPDNDTSDFRVHLLKLIDRCPKETKHLQVDRLQSKLLDFYQSLPPLKTQHIRHHGDGYSQNGHQVNDDLLSLAALASTSSPPPPPVSGVSAGFSAKCPTNLTPSGTKLELTGSDSCEVNPSCPVSDVVVAAAISNRHIRQQFIDAAASVLSSSLASELMLSAVAELIIQKLGRPLYDDVKREYGSLINAISDIPRIVLRREGSQVFCSLLQPSGLR